MIDRRIKANLSDIADAINGRIRRHHRDMLEYHWNSMTFFDEQISSIESKIDQQLILYRKEAELLETIPGVNKVAAATFIAEMGVDMSVFNSSKHLASWAGIVQETTKVPVKKTSKITHGNKALDYRCRVCFFSNETAKIIVSQPTEIE
ncbi:IS110 family transposase [Anaerobacillus sp. HL2]|nr:IS110 family transposase [Anaerobacillus sp. HL2]